MSLILSLLLSVMPFISASAAKGMILLPVSFLLSYFRRLFPSLWTPFLFFCSTAVWNCGISAVSRKFLTFRFFPFQIRFCGPLEHMSQCMVAEPIYRQIDSSLARTLTFDTSGIELYVAENNPKTLNLLSADLRLITKTIRMLTRINWLTPSCPHRPLPVPVRNSSILTAISGTLINSPSSPTASVLPAIPPFWMMILRPPIPILFWGIPLLIPSKPMVFLRTNSIFSEPCSLITKGMKAPLKKSDITFTVIHIEEKKHLTNT